VGRNGRGISHRLDRRSCRIGIRAAQFDSQIGAPAALDKYSRILSIEMGETSIPRPDFVDVLSAFQ
jgi:hypothetical protein